MKLDVILVCSTIESCSNCVGIMHHRMVHQPLRRGRLDEVGGMLTGRLDHAVRMLALAVRRVRPKLAGRLVYIDA